MPATYADRTQDHTDRTRTITRRAVPPFTSLSRRLSPSTVGECNLLFSAVLKIAVRDRLIAANPAKDVRLAKKRQQAGDRQTISREEFTTRQLPAVPDRHRAIVALAGGTGLRWGERVGLRWKSVDLVAVHSASQARGG